MRVTAVMVAVLLSSAIVTSAYAASSYTFYGSGWGHGIGMSQWGAKGYADRGWTAEQITAHYYQGTSVSTLADRTVTVNLDKNKAARTSWAIRPASASATLQVRVGGVVKATLSSSDAPYTVSASGTSVRVARANGTVVGTYAGSVDVVGAGGLPPLTQVVSGSGPYGLTDMRYRGTLRITSNGSAVKCVNVLPMDDYLYGVVPAESSASWPIEALKAQALVARSYAGVSTGELYPTTQSQVYKGYNYEDPRTNAAVDLTADKYVTYGGTVIQTFFFSSSGGHTANIEDVWLSSAPKPYYTGVPDPYGLGPSDPWPVPPQFDAMTLASKFANYTRDGIAVFAPPAGAGTTVSVVGLALDRAESGYVRTVDVTWSNGAVSRGVRGDYVRGALGLRSTKFHLSPITRIAYADRYGTSVKVSQTAYPSAGVAKVAVIANGGDAQFPDALTSAALGGVAEGPVLLTRKDSLPGEVAAELRRLGVTRAYIVGGTAVVSPGVQNAIQAIVPSVTRLAGGGQFTTDRYGTAASVGLEMRRLGATSDRVMIASGERWADAAVAAAAAAGSRTPLLLTASSNLPGSTRAALGLLGSKRSVVFGGPAAIGSGAISALCAATGESAPSVRFGTVGDRYTTASQAATWSMTNLGFTADRVYIASGEKFPDSVTGGVLAGKEKKPLILTPAARVSDSTRAFLTANRATISSVVFLGGPMAISDATAMSLDALAE